MRVRSQTQDLSLPLSGIFVLIVLLTLRSVLFRILHKHGLSLFVIYIYYITKEMMKESISEREKLIYDVETVSRENKAIQR